VGRQVVGECLNGRNDIVAVRVALFRMREEGQQVKAPQPGARILHRCQQMSLLEAMPDRIHLVTS
jgi:hypothetical protein